MDVRIAQNANLNNPVAVDLLLIRDEQLLETLLARSAREWFEQKSQFRKDYLLSGDIEMWGWEWVPGQRVDPKQLPLLADAVGGILYADYLTPGAHRAAFDPYNDFALILDETDFRIEAPDKIEN